ncbi:hypothetical protein [Xanthomonas sp. 3498]|uniref:hypothetical protein n=1 Tax=Xanthomonas sp. 3498 TaxID=2663863 RepID=UPI0017EC5FF7|nr:hypothetical protein [Xanthomonas sp. 3498]MBB5876145.1 hypothetical protein [Xanthomonas sp. 3498]
MSDLHLDANSVFNGIIVALLLGGGGWALGWARMRLGLMNDRITLKIHRAELNKVLNLQRDSAKVAAFLLTQILFCFAILGVAMAYSTIAFMDGGAKWMAPVVSILGLAIYTCAVYAIGIIIRVKKGAKYVQRQEAKIAALEEGLERRNAVKQKARE